MGHLRGLFETVICKLNSGFEFRAISRVIADDCECNLVKQKDEDLLTIYLLIRWDHRVNSGESHHV